MYLSEIIKNDVREWLPGDIVLIDAPTGSGKTTAVLSEIRREALRRGKEVLYVSNRKLLGEQIKAKLGEEIGYPRDRELLYSIDNFYGIKVMSYQKLQQYEKNDIPILLDQFSFVVFDEFHYILSDAMFQADIFYFLKWIDKSIALKSKGIVLISATPKESFEFLIENTKFFKCCQQRLRRKEIRNESNCQIFSLYCEPNLRKREKKLWNYNVSVNNDGIIPCFYKSEKSVLKLIEADKSSEKWLIFISQKKQGHLMYEQLINILGSDKVAFLSAEEVENENKIVSKIVENQKFEEKVLIATKVLENGISICDEELKNIVVSTIWQDEFLQMIGRKRRERDENIRLYMSCKSLNAFNGVRNKILLPLYSYIKIHPADRPEKILQDKEYYSFAKKFMVFERNKKQYRLNPAGKYVIKKRLDFVERMMGDLKVDEKAFVREQLKWLNLPCNDKNLVILEDDFQKQKKHDFEQYLKEKCGEKMDKEKQMIFRMYFKEMFEEELKLKQNIPSIHIINEFLKSFSAYVILSEIESRKTIWRIEKYDEG